MIDKVIGLKSNNMLDSRTLSSNGIASEPLGVRMFQRSLCIVQPKVTYFKIDVFRH